MPRTGNTSSLTPSRPANKGEFKKKKKKKVIGKRSDLAALYSLMGKEGWQERKNPEFC